MTKEQAESHLLEVGQDPKKGVSEKEKTIQAIRVLSGKPLGRQQ